MEKERFSHYGTEEKDKYLKRSIVATATTSRNQNTLTIKLYEWAVKYKVPVDAIDDLLKILRKENLPVPKDAKELLELGKNTNETKEFQSQSTSRS